MRDILIQISGDGRSVYFLYNDEVRGNLIDGELDVRRASNVIFDRESGKWLVEVINPDGSVSLLPDQFFRRGAAIDFEIKRLQEKLVENESFASKRFE